MASILMTITKASRFASDAPGLEKTLRLLQSLAQIAAAYSLSPSDAKPWLLARKQFALGRRYLRFFKFIDAFTFAFSKFNSSSGITAILEVGKWSCLGMYFLFESLTIMDAMGVWTTTWGPMLLLEGNKFWFYSLFLSLVLSFLQLYFLLFSSQNPPHLSVEEKVLRNGKTLKTSAANEESRAKEMTVKTRLLMKKIMTDGCDLLIPGSITAWIETSQVTVGMATVVSTVLSSGDIWDRV